MTLTPPAPSPPSADQASPGRQLITMVGTTWPIVAVVFRRHVGRVVAVGLLGVLLGVVPTVKSELEGGVLDVVNEVVRSPQVPLPVGTAASPAAPGGDEAAFRERVRTTVSQPVSRFNTPAAESDGMPERITRTLVRGTTIWGAVGAYALVAILGWLLAIAATAARARVGKDLFSVLRGIGLKGGVLTDPHALPAMHNPSGQYASAIHQGASTVNGTFESMLSVGEYVFALLTTIALVATKHPGFALACLALVAAQVAVSLVQARRLRAGREALDETRNQLVGRTNDILAKRDILVAYEQQDTYVEKLRGATASFAEVERRLEVREQLYRGLSALVADYGRITILVAAVGVALAFGSRAVGDVGDAYFLVSIYVRMFVPASNLLNRIDSVWRSASTARTYLRLVEQQSRADVRDEAERLLSRAAGDAPVSGRREHGSPPSQWRRGAPIVFRGVSFAYPGATPGKGVLHDVSFTIPASAVTLLVGPSGSGKTTIARLLLGFWRLRHGEIAIGGSSLSQFTPTELRAAMSYVSQGDYIVDETIGENLAWGTSAEPITPEDMRSALHAVGIDRVDGYEDLLSAPAAAMSGGQKQRLSVARMLLDESEIVIMDEPLAGVDVFTTRDLLGPLVGVLKGRQHTVLIISHRLAFAAFADHVVVMNESGKICEEGSPSELLAHASTFASLHAAAVAELDFRRPATATPAGPSVRA